MRDRAPLGTVPLPSRLLAVTDRHQSVDPLPERVTALLEAGLRWLWLRDRDLPGVEREALARSLRERTRRAGASLTIGGDIDLAAALEADGVHLGRADEVAAARRRLGRGALIGVSAHGFAQVRAATAAGADYATLSPIFASASKPGYGPALGLAALGEAARSGLPVLALGGVDAFNAPLCLGAGAAGLALMGAPMRQGGQALRDLLAAIGCGDPIGADTP